MNKIQESKWSKWFLSIVLLVVLLQPQTGSANEYGVYVVKQGDSLWKISQIYNVTVEQLKDLNGLTTNIIHPGQKLKLPVVKNSSNSSSSGKSYTVKKGDNLWAIARKHGTNVITLKKWNGLTSNIIHPGQQLSIYVTDTQNDKIVNNKTETKNYSQSEIEWLAKIIEAEAEGEPYLGKVAVGSVVMNRIEHNWFPNTIKEVIFQKYNGNYQFSPVADGKIYRIKPTAQSYRAAREAIKGVDPTNGGIYFYNPKIAKSSWIRTRKVITIIGNHHFAI